MESTILIAAVALLASSGVHSQGPPSAPAPVSTGLLEELPLAFVENRGQWDTPARFVARRGPMVARAEPRALVVQLEERDEEGAGRALVARLEFEGAREGAELVGEEPQGGVRNYFVGDRERWRAGVPAYSKVVYRDLYDGIDLCLRERAGRLEYDLLLEPDARLERFVVRCEGVDGLELEEDGSLVMQTELGPIRQSPPETWQVLPNGERCDIGSRFQVLDEKRFGFALEEHLPGLPVVIDPGLEWSTCLGGSDLDTAGARIDPSGRVVLCGQTWSDNFPRAMGSLQGPSDGFVAVLDPRKSGDRQMIWATYLGGSGEDGVGNMEVDSAGDIFFAGRTNSPDLGCTGDAYQGTHGGGWDAFIGEIDGQDGSIRYLSYFGAEGQEAGAEVALKEPRTVTISGTTNSSNLPMVGAYQATKSGHLDYYIAQLDLDLGPPYTDQLVYSTYLGGQNFEGGSPDTWGAYYMDLALLSSGELALTGMSNSADYPVTADAYNPYNVGSRDVVVTILDPTLGTAGLVYSTYLGDDAWHDDGLTVDVSEDGVITVGGATRSPDFPTTEGAFSRTFIGPMGFSDGFLARIDPSLGPPYTDQLVYSTFLGGRGTDAVWDVRHDAEGRIVAVGVAGIGALNNTFPTTCGAYDETGDGADGFLLYLDPSGNGASDLLYSTVVGGSTGDYLYTVDLVTDGALKAVCGGDTDSTDFPLVNPFQAYQGGVDAVALRLEINPHTYCIAAANSAGPDGALICGTGSVSIADNAFTLSVSGAIPDRPGLFYCGPDAIEVPFGDGYRCVGGSIKRLYPAEVADGSGSVSRWVDFNVPPGGKFTPGSTWHFQYWYRDQAAGGASFNLSNGLKVYFHP